MSTTITWAFIYGHPGTDPNADRVSTERDGLRTILVPVPDESMAAQVAVDLIESDQIELLELCGGFSAPDAARVIEAVAGRVPVGHVSYALESIQERRPTKRSLRPTHRRGTLGRPIWGYPCGTPLRSPRRYVVIILRFHGALSRGAESRKTTPENDSGHDGS